MDPTAWIEEGQPTAAGSTGRRRHGRLLAGGGRKGARAVELDLSLNVCLGPPWTGRPPGLWDCGLAPQGFPNKINLILFIASP